MKEISQKTLENIEKFTESAPREIGDSVGVASVILSRELGNPEGVLDLDSIFKIQEGLNNLIFHKQNIMEKTGLQLTIQKLREEFESGPIGPNSDSAAWALKYSRALKEELEEFEECFPWKWWSKDGVDKQNAHVEVADLLFFVVSIAQAVGLNGKKLSSLYNQKAVVNFERQFGGYSKATKDESDNKGISA